MPPLTAPRAGALALLALAAACSTRVVDLALPGEAGPEVAQVVKCEVVMRADGTQCRLCFAADGMPAGSTCGMALPPAPPAQPDGGAMVPPSRCVQIADKDPRCLQCDQGGMSYTTCLSCEQATPTGQGDSCRVCVWKDLPTARCLQCLAPTGALTHDDCNAVRRETVVR